MPSPRLSIVIPTHKRAAILTRCLEHLEQQTIAQDLEIIVVSDGHDPETSALFEGVENGKWKMESKTREFHQTFHFPFSAFHFVEIPKSQQGIARNKGVALATAPIVLFAQDDIFLMPDACERHVKAHEKTTVGDTACLGFTTWDPVLTITPVMRWLEETGWQFGYPLLEPYRHAFVPIKMQHRFTYTSHISVPTEIAKKNKFREDVTLYGWEDIEWGMRLRDAGVKLFYEPGAKAYHHHPLTLEQSLKRMEEIGKSAVYLSRIVPELDRLPKGWKRAAYHVLACLPTMRGKHAAAFLRGIREGEKSPLR